MAQPVAYDPETSFAVYEGHPPYIPGGRFDTEFNAIQATTDQLRANLALIQRDDGQLADEIVTLDSLSDTVRALLGGASTSTITGLLAEADYGPFTNVASAATTDIGAVSTMFVNITGSVTITSFGPKANKLRIVRFSGTPVLTHSSSLILPGSANITAAVGDTMVITSSAAANWRVISYQRAAVAPGTFAVLRQPLTADGTYYVRADGSDTNTGLANTAAGAFMTIQTAVDTVLNKVDFNGFDVRINVIGPGTFAPFTVDRPHIGRGKFYFQFLNAAAAAYDDATIVSASGTTPTIWVTNGASVYLLGGKYEQLGTGSCISASLNSFVQFGYCNFGTCGSLHVDVGAGSVVIPGWEYKISGGAQGHYHTGNQSNILVGSPTITLVGTPHFSSYFAGTSGGYIDMLVGPTFVGSATGQRYFAHKNGTIDARTTSETYLPGDTAGTTASGGKYVGDSTSDDAKKLTANRTYYVRTDGSDTNNGLTNTAGGAFLTIQAAIDATERIDLNGYDVTISVGAGTFTGGIVAATTFVGGLVSIVGQGSGSTTINSASHCIFVAYHTTLTVSSIRLQSSAGCGCYAYSAANITIGSDVKFGACADSHLKGELQSILDVQALYAIAGGAVCHINVNTNSLLRMYNRANTNAGTNAFLFFALVRQCSTVELVNSTYTGGTITGQRYLSDQNAVIFTSGAGAGYLPGNSAGATSTGGQYI